MNIDYLVRNYKEFEHEEQELILKKVKKLYTESFPIEEQRPWMQILELLDRESDFQLDVFVDLKTSEVSAFMTQWQLNNQMIFIEHFAVEPKFRNHGLGRRIMSQLLEAQSQVILECELPLNELSQRRIAFYESLGIQVLSKEYHQPLYSKSSRERGKVSLDFGIPMYLLSSFPLPDEEIPNLVERIHQVYLKD